MVRSYQAEPGIQTYFDGHVQKQSAVQVGLLVGKQAVGARDVLLGLIATPASQGGKAAAIGTGSVAGSALNSSARGKKGSSGAAAPAAPGSAAAVASVTLDVEWVSEHAASVARMLPGGLCVLGVYLFTSEPGYQSVSSQLQPVLQAVRDLLPSNAPSRELVVLHADAGSRKVVARSSAAPEGAGPAPAHAIAELKWAPCVANLMTLTCRWPLNVSLPVPRTASGLQDELQRLQDTTDTSIQSAVACLPDGTLPSPEALLLDVSAGRPPPMFAIVPSTSLPNLHIQLLPVAGTALGQSPAAGVQAAGTADAARLAGQVTLQGTVCGVAVVHKRQAWPSAVRELKADVRASLAARAELLVDDALTWQEEQAAAAAPPTTTTATSQGGAGGDAGPARAPLQHPLLKGPRGLEKAYAAALPHRIVLPALGGLPFSDYLMPGEEPGDAVARAIDLLGAAGDLPAAQDLEHEVQMLEGPAVAPRRLAAWDPFAPPGNDASAGAVVGQAVLSTKGHQPGGLPCSTTVLGGAAVGVAVVVAGLAALLGGMST